MNKTSIQYCDYTWNPLAMRCTPISPACVNCWHLRQARRLACNKLLHPDRRAAWAGRVAPVLNRDELMEPLRFKRPYVIAVQFMGDLFHGNVSPVYIREIFNVMLQADWHVYLVLTKRAVAMGEFVSRFNLSLNDPLIDLPKEFAGGLMSLVGADHIYFGITVENRHRMDSRWRYLRDMAVSKRWLSMEPLLERVDLPDDLNVDWIVVGGESGPGARWMDEWWAYDLKKRASDLNIAFYMKQMSQGIGSQGIGSQGIGSQGIGSQGIGSQGIGSRGHKSRGRRSKDGEIPPYLRTREYPSGFPMSKTSDFFV